MISRKPAGPDGVTDLDYKTEFLRMMDYEKQLIRLREKQVGGYENLIDERLGYELYVHGDTDFYGPSTGGKLYRVNGAPFGSGPFFGGNLNYIKQGMLVRAAGRPFTFAEFSIKAWIRFGDSSQNYTEQRLKLARYGYDAFGEGE